MISLCNKSVSVKVNAFARGRQIRTNLIKLYLSILFFLHLATYKVIKIPNLFDQSALEIRIRNLG